MMGNRHFRALSVAVLAGAAICLSWWLCGDGNGIDWQDAESGAIPDPVASPLPTTKRLAPQVMTKAEEQTRLVRRPDEAASQPQAVPMSAREVFQSVPGRGDGDSTLSDAVRLAAEKSQLMDDCERRISSSHSLLKRLADDPKENAVVRKSAFRALWALDGL